MPNARKIYLKELRQLNTAFAHVKRHGVSYELDTDDIEEVLEDWQDLIAELYQDGEENSCTLAAHIETQLDYFAIELETYIEARITYEEEDAHKQASNRLTQSRVENYHHSLKQASQKPDAMRYYRVSSALRVPEERSERQQVSRLTQPPKSRLELDEG